MPKYTFICPECGLEEQSYVPRKVKEISCCRCAPDKESWMKRQLPKVSAPDITEVVDHTTGATAKQDQSTMMEERHDRYFWSVEVPRLVASGIYGIQTMLENGWIYLDDKENMHIHNKPPYER